MNFNFFYNLTFLCCFLICFILSFSVYFLYPRTNRMTIRTQPWHSSISYEGMLNEFLFWNSLSKRLVSWEERIKKKSEFWTGNFYIVFNNYALLNAIKILKNTIFKSVDCLVKCVVISMAIKRRLINGNSINDKVFGATPRLNPHWIHQFMNVFLIDLI